MLYLISIVACFSAIVAGSPVSKERGTISTEEVSISRYPYQAAVIHNTSNSWILPGAIIHEQYIVTSALFPIFWEDSSAQVIVGESEIENEKQLIPVEKVIINPNFSLGTDYNVALIKLKVPIQFSKNVKKISISSTSPIDSEAVMTRWVRSASNTYILTKFGINVLNRESCQPLYFSSVVSATSVCGYIHDDKLDSKESGAPLVQNGKLVGLFQGTPLAPYYSKDSTDSPRVFTDLSTVKIWVEEIINDE